MLFSASPELVIHLFQLGIFLFGMEETRTDEHRDALVIQICIETAQNWGNALSWKHKTTKKEMISKWQFQTCLIRLDDTQKKKKTPPQQQSHFFFRIGYVINLPKLYSFHVVGQTTCCFDSSYSTFILVSEMQIKSLALANEKITPTRSLFSFF